MPRKKITKKKDVLVDPIYNSSILAKLITKVMYSGKKNLAQQIVYGAMDTIQEKMKEDPRQGALFVFTNRDRNRVKLLHFDGTGLWVCVKRLEKGTFAWPAGVDVENGKLRLGAEALALLLDGVDLKGAKMRPWYQRE